MHGLAHGLIAAEGERQIRHAARHMGMGQMGADLARGFDEIDAIIVMFFNAGGDSKNIRIEDNIFRREADLIDKNAIGA